MPQRTDEEWSLFAQKFLEKWDEQPLSDGRSDPRGNNPAMGEMCRTIRAELIAEFKRWMEPKRGDQLPVFSIDIDEAFKP
jgi:hypothetical protein